MIENSIMNLGQVVYLYFLALALAFLEVQIEGEQGWARQLPCWRPKGTRWFSRVFSKVMSGKELTGYHIGVFSFAALVLHIPYVWGVPWSVAGELGTISIFFLFVVVWDLLWFVINPHYGILKFHPGCAVWHKTWIGIAPIDYYGAIVLSFLFYALNVYQGKAEYMEWFVMVGYFVAFLGLTVILTEGIKMLKKKQL